MSLADLLAIDTAEKRPARKVTHPKGWEPGVVWSPATGGTVVTGPLDDEPDPALWALIVSDFGLDSSRVTVDINSVQIRAWDQAVGNGETARMRHYKANLRAVDQSPTDRADVDALCRQIAKRRPIAPRIAKIGRAHV